MGAQNMSNRFYQVHPRRNDRLTRVSTVMQAIFPEVDFSEFCFTRHLLTRLAEVAPERFPILREELQAAWTARMRTFLEATGLDRRSCCGSRRTCPRTPPGRRGPTSSRATRCS